MRGDDDGDRFSLGEERRRKRGKIVEAFDGTFELGIDEDENWSTRNKTGGRKRLEDPSASM